MYHIRGYSHRFDRLEFAVSWCERHDNTTTKQVVDDNGVVVYTDYVVIPTQAVSDKSGQLIGWQAI